MIQDETYARPYWLVGDIIINVNEEHGVMKARDDYAINVTNMTTGRFTITHVNYFPYLFARTLARWLAESEALKANDYVSLGMDQIELKQSADFLSIAIECIETGSYDVAIDFIEDVADELEDESRVDTLEEAIESIEDGDTEKGCEQVALVNEQLLQEIDAL